MTRILTEQYARAKDILNEYADGHHQLRDLLLSREVIFTEDVESVFGKRKWASRADEIIKANEEEKESDADTDSGSDKNTLPPPIPEDEKNDK